MPTKLAELPADKAIKLQLAWDAAKQSDPGRNQHRQCAEPGCENRWELRDERKWCSQHAAVCKAVGCHQRAATSHTFEHIWLRLGYCPGHQDVSAD